LSRAAQNPPNRIKDYERIREAGDKKPKDVREKRDVEARCNKREEKIENQDTCNGGGRPNLNESRKLGIDVWISFWTNRTLVLVGILPKNTANWHDA
jgi:hypothetical protein